MSGYHKSFWNRYGLIFPVVIIGFILRFTILFSNGYTNSDGVLYSWIASNLADGYGYTIAEGTALSDSRAWHVPAFPLVLAVFYKVFGKGPLISRLPAVLFGTASILLLYLFVKRYLDRRTAMLAALFMTLHPQFVSFSAGIMTESMYIFLLLLFLYYLLTINESTKNEVYILTGFMGGLCYLTRTIGILTIPVFMVYAVYSLRKNFIRGTALFLGGFLLPALPWWIWSYVSYGTPFSAEQNTVIQMYQFEFGYYEGKRLGFFQYLFGFHDFKAIFMGLLDGAVRILKATLIPTTLFHEEALFSRSPQLVFTAVIAAVTVIGMKLKTKKGGSRVEVALILALVFSLFGYAWGGHVLPAKSSTMLRYALPLSLILIIYLASGVKKLFDGPMISKTLAMACVLIVISSSLLILRTNNRVSASWEEDVYSLPLFDSIKNDSILASSPQRLKKFGFQNVHPIGKMDFNGILGEIETLQINYVIVDSSSLYNDDQIYLVNHWYRDRIPDRLEKVDIDFFPISIYKVTTTGE